MQGELKRTCSGQCETPISFASVHSFLPDQAAGSPREGGQVVFPSARLNAKCEASVWTQHQKGSWGFREGACDTARYFCLNENQVMNLRSLVLTPCYLLLTNLCLEWL